MTSNLSELSARVKRSIEFSAIFRELYPTHVRKGPTWLCPFHDDRTPSLQINKYSGTAYCHGSCAKSYSVIDLWAFKHGLRPGEAAEELASRYLHGSDLPQTDSRRSPSSKQIERIYDYVDESGKLLYQVIRYVPKSFVQRRPDGKGGWEWKGVSKVRRAIYHLPELTSSNESTVFFCEGEKDVETLEALGLIATTSAGGSNGWKLYSKDAASTAALRGKSVVILPDNDDPGEKYAKQVAASLSSVAASVKIVKLPGLPAGGDVTDFVRSRDAGQAKNDLLRIVAEYQESDSEPEARSNGFRELINILTDLHFDVFLDQFETLWTTHAVDSGGAVNVPALGHRAYRHYLAQLVDARQREVRKDTWDNACHYFASKHGEQRDLFVRIAVVDGSFLIDSGRDDGAVFQVNPSTGTWRVAKSSKSVFKRFGQVSLPVPEAGGRVSDIFDFIPIRDDDTRNLLAVWLVGSLAPDIDHPGIIMHGLQGAGKTVACIMLKSLTDPCRTMSMALSKDEPELIQAMSHHSICCFDNIHALPQWASDCLCRGITGLGHQKRRLHTDDDDFRYEYRSTFILNCISVPSLLPDLSDRSLLIEVPRLSESERRPRDDLMKGFDAAAPRIFGAMLDAFAGAARILPSIILDAYPRMADWTRWGCAIAEAIGIGKDRFLAAYSRTRHAQHASIVNSVPICLAMKHLMLVKDDFRGTASQLFKLLCQEDVMEAAGVSPGSTKGPGFWPANASSLSKMLTRYSDNLREMAIGVEFQRDGSGRSIRIHTV